jgi:diaminopimelate decarboxylase
MLTSKSFYYNDGQLYCEGVALAEIATAVATPVYIYSQAELLRRANAYRQTAAAVTPDHLVCYAVKANSNPSLLHLLADNGLGADVTSGGELFLARHAGFAPSKILYSGVAKTAPEIEAALLAGIRALHVESEMEMAVIREVAAAHGRVARIAVRVNPNISTDTHPHISTGQYAHKFGVTLDQARRLLVAAAADPWLEPVGLAAHIGSQITDLEPFVASARYLAAAAHELAAEGIQLQYLDVGGGLGIGYMLEDAPEPAAWVTAVAPVVAEAGYGLVMEPGRSIIGPAGILLAQVVYTKQQGQKHFVITDTGMTELIRPSLYNAYHQIVPVVEERGRGGDKETRGGGDWVVDVVGPVCETGDFLARDRVLAPVGPGDLLAVMQAGAYGFAMSSNYNGRLRPAEVLVNGDQFQVIRRRQSYEQLLADCG